MASSSTYSSSTKMRIYAAITVVVSLLASWIWTEGVEGIGLMIAAFFIALILYSIGELAEYMENVEPSPSMSGTESTSGSASPE